MENEGVVKRIKTGIAGLDRLIAGGVPVGSQVLLLGSPGAGKTLMSLEILYHNAKLEVPSTFITTEEMKESIISNVENAFYAFEEFNEVLEKNTIQLIHKPIIDDFKSRENFERFVAEIIEAMNANKSRILVFDSLSSLRTVMPDDRTFTRSAAYMTEVFREASLTTFITMEANPKADIIESGLYGTSMFDGLIKLYINQAVGASQYMVEISKLRNSAHKLADVPFQITSNGLDVLAD
ncbi:MAG: ATPase domain-containing protein [Candidatus Micrarchaeia archaeon]